MAEVSQATKQAVALAINDSQLIKFGEFTLKSGVVSPFYIDLRQAQSHPDTFHTVISAYAELLSDVDPSSKLAGVPEAATPLAAALGYDQRRSLIQPRKVVKDHGTKSSVEGDYAENDSVVVVDDLITKGDSKLEAIQQLEDAGLVVEKFIVLIDREQGGLQMLADRGYKIEAAIKIRELIDILHEQNKISAEQYETVVNVIEGN